MKAWKISTAIAAFFAASATWDLGRSDAADGAIEVILALVWLVLANDEWRKG